MCVNEHANRIEVCTVGDLKPGQQYRTPDGSTLLVVEDLFDGPSDAAMVVDIATGRIDREPGSVKLGLDRAGRLYASRYLNERYPKSPAQTGIVAEGINLGTGEVGPVEPTREELERAGLIEGPNYSDFPEHDLGGEG